METTIKFLDIKGEIVVEKLKKDIKDMLDEVKILKREISENTASFRAIQEQLKYSKQKTINQ